MKILRTLRSDENEITCDFKFMLNDSFNSFNQLVCKTHLQKKTQRFKTVH